MEYTNIYNYKKNDKVILCGQYGYINDVSDGSYNVTIGKDMYIDIERKELLPDKPDIIHIIGKYDKILLGDWFYKNNKKDKYKIELDIEKKTGFFVNTSDIKMDLVVDINIDNNNITGSFYGVCGVSKIYGKVNNYQFIAYIDDFFPLNSEQIKNLGFEDNNDYDKFSKLKFNNVNDYKEFKVSGLTKTNFYKFKKSMHSNLEDFLEDENNKRENIVLKSKRCLQKYLVSNSNDDDRFKHSEKKLKKLRKMALPCRNTPQETLDNIYLESLSNKR